MKKQKEILIKKNIIQKKILSQICLIIISFVIIISNIYTPVLYADNTTSENNMWTGTTSTESGLIDSADYGSYVTIAGDEKQGYYLKFVDDIDDKLNKIIKDDSGLYYNLGVKDPSTLKKMIKAELTTQFPNFGKPVKTSGGSNVANSGAFGWPIDTQYPLDDSDETNLFGERVHPIYGDVRMHTGVDIQAPNGSECYAIGNGTVIQTGDAGGWGNTIQLNLGQVNGQEITCTYCHLPDDGIYVNVGDTVTKGQQIAVTGTTGQTQGGHIHFEMKADGEYVDPMLYISTDGSAQNIPETPVVPKVKPEDKNSEDDNKVQGGITLKRATPNKEIGTYKEGLGKDTPANKENNVTEGRGKKEDIPVKIKIKMKEASMKGETTATFDKLTYLKIPYLNYWGDIATGTMIVNSDIADEILDIFQELYNIKYPIQNMQIIDEYFNKEKGNKTEDLVYRSVEDNNTVSFYYDKISPHSTGNAIDLNPVVNPTIIDGKPTHGRSNIFVDRTPRKNLSDNDNAALITKESSVYKIFEKYGWTWTGEGANPDYQHFEKTSIKTENTVNTSIDSKVYDLSYVPKETFDSLVNKNDKRALQVFTLDDNFQVIIATWSYSTDGGLKISKGKTLNYRKAVAKYTMPYEFLAAILVQSVDAGFTESMAQLAMDSEYVISILDNVSSTKTVITETTVTAAYYEGSSEVYESSSASTSTKTNITENVSQNVEVTYVDCWYIKFYKDMSFSRESTKAGKINAMGIVTEKNSEGLPITNTNRYQDNWERYRDVTTTTTTTVNTSKYEYKTGNEHVGGNAEKFVNIYQDNKYITARRNIYMAWLEESMERYVATANLIDVMKYLLYQGDSLKYFGTSIIKFEDYKPDAFSSTTTNKPIAGGNVQEKVWKNLINAGYSEVAVASVMGNIEGESRFDPAAEQDGGGGRGLIQWDDRAEALYGFAESRGKPWQDVDIQIEFLLGELSETGGADGFAKFQFYNNYENWKTTSSVDEATELFCTYFERAGIPHLDVRIEAANNYYNQYKGTK